LKVEATTRQRSWSKVTMQPAGEEPQTAECVLRYLLRLPVANARTRTQVPRAPHVVWGRARCIATWGGSLDPEWTAGERRSQRTTHSEPVNATRRAREVFPYSHNAAAFSVPTGSQRYRTPDTRPRSRLTARLHGRTFHPLLTGPSGRFLELLPDGAGPAVLEASQRWRLLRATLRRASTPPITSGSFPRLDQRQVIGTARLDGMSHI